jgi:ABC-2 type transport system ATP-binding protein
MQEVEAVCSRVIIINKGKIVADGAIDEIKGGKINRSQVVIAEFSGIVNEVQLLAINGVKKAGFSGKFWEIESTGETDIRPAIFEFAVKNNLVLLTLSEKQQNLESVFHEVTQNR